MLRKNLYIYIIYICINPLVYHLFFFSRNNTYIYIYYTHMKYHEMRYPWWLVNAKLHAPVSVANFSPGSLMFWRGATKHTQGCDTRRTQGPHMVFCENFGKHLVNLRGYYHCYHIKLQLCGVPKFQTHPHGTFSLSSFREHFCHPFHAYQVIIQLGKMPSISDAGGFRQVFRRRIYPWYRFPIWIQVLSEKLRINLMNFIPPTQFARFCENITKHILSCFWLLGLFPHVSPCFPKLKNSLW